MLTDKHQGKPIPSFSWRNNRLDDGKGRLCVGAGATAQEQLDNVEDTNSGLSVDVVSYNLWLTYQHL